MIKVATPPTYAPIILADETLSADATAFTAVTIPDGITQIKIHFTGQTSSDQVLYLRINGDTGANYIGQQITGSGATTAANSGATDKANICSNLLNSVVNQVKCDLSNQVGYKKNFLGVGAGYLKVCIAAGYWNSTDTITQILIFLNAGNILAGSRLKVLGWK